MDIRETVWQKYIGLDVDYATCWVGCGRQFNINSFICHNICGSNDIGDIRPICSPCSKYVGNINIEQFKSDCKFVTPPNYLNKDLTENELMFECFTKNVTTCFATKYGLKYSLHLVLKYCHQYSKTVLFILNQENSKHIKHEIDLWHCHNGVMTTPNIRTEIAVYPLSTLYNSYVVTRRANPISARVPGDLDDIDIVYTIGFSTDSSDVVNG